MNMNDLRKSFIIQAINFTSGNFKLSYKDLETLSVLREFLKSSKDVEVPINKMKKITELSKLGVRLNRLLNFISDSEIDFLKITEQFKNESLVIRDELKTLFENETPNSLRQIIKRASNINTGIENAVIDDDGISIIQQNSEDDLTNKEEIDKLKESFILDDRIKENNFDFVDFSEQILRPIKKLDKFLTKLKMGEINRDDLNLFLNQMKQNTQLAKKSEFDLISKMHVIFTNSLELIEKNKIDITIELIDKMRACLIVIVALVKKKDVDISEYIEKAERLEIQILSL